MLFSEHLTYKLYAGIRELDRRHKMHRTYEVRSVQGMQMCVFHDRARVFLSILGFILLVMAALTCKACLCT